MFKRKPNINIKFNPNGYPELQFMGNVTEEALNNAVKLLADYRDALYPKIAVSKVKPEDDPESALYGFHTIWEALV